MTVFNRLAVGWRAFQAAKTTAAYVPPRNANLSPDGAVQDADDKLRAWGRHFEENTDIAVAILDELVNGVVGEGIEIEPMVMEPKTGLPWQEINAQLFDLIEEWSERCDVTRQLPYGEYQRLTARAWFRDGDHFTHHIQGFNRGFEFGPNEIPYALEMVEADRVPLMLTTDDAPRVFQGVELDKWHRPSAFRLLKEPVGGNDLRFSPVATAGFIVETSRIPAEQMTQLAWRRRYPQVRGVSIFAPITRRLHDIHDIDESIRIAERSKSRIAFWVKRDPDMDMPEVTGEKPEREIALPQGGVMDELLPGEDIGSAFNDSPNTHLAAFRDGQVRAACAGAYVRYSPVARDYNGTYSAQRQELVEASFAYKPLTKLFVSRIVRPQYARLVQTAILTGRLQVPPGVSLRQLLRADFHGPSIPWIDPLKEVKADIEKINNDLATREMIVRKSGVDPRKVPERQPIEQTPAPSITSPA